MYASLLSSISAAFPSHINRFGFISLTELVVSVGTMYRLPLSASVQVPCSVPSSTRSCYTKRYVSSARDSQRFTVSLNVESQKKVNFKLTYEELLSRKLGTYRHVINLDPGQIVNDLKVTTRIEESSSITTLKVPELRTSNEIVEDPSGKPGLKTGSSCIVF
jgi:hypothetical protein